MRSGDPAKPSGGSWLSIVMAMLAAVVLFGMLLAVLVLSSGAPWLPLIFVAAIGFIALHYFTWGWWLGRMIRADVAEEELASRSHEERAKDAGIDQPR